MDEFVKCRVWSVECAMVWSAERIVWNSMWSVKCGVYGVDGVERRMLSVICEILRTCLAKLHYRHNATSHLAQACHCRKGKLQTHNCSKHCARHEICTLSWGWDHVRTRILGHSHARPT